MKGSSLCWAMSTHEKSPFPPPPSQPKMFPSSEPILLPGKCFYTGLTQGIVVERLWSADADQHCREAVDRTKLIFPWRAFLHALYHFCTAKQPGPLITAFCISPTSSVIEIGSYFVVCQVPDRHQCENMTNRKQKMKYHFFSNFIENIYLISS